MPMCIWRKLFDNKLDAIATYNSAVNCGADDAEGE